MKTEINLLKQENARLVTKITRLESKKIKLLKQIAKEKVKYIELRTRIKELVKGRIDTIDVIAELKAEVIKLKDDNVKNNWQTFLQSEVLSEMTVISKEMISGNEQNTIDKIESQSSASSNTIILTSNVYEKKGVSDYKLSEEKRQTLS